MSQIYNETLVSLLTAKINRKTYDALEDDEQIVPKEMVEMGMRAPKTVAQRKKELDEHIETKERMLAIIQSMIDEENKDKVEDRNTTG